MQQSSREMQGMASPLNGMSSSAGAGSAAVAAAQISLQELHDGHRQQQIQNAGMQVPASHFGHSAGGHDDFIDQMICSLPSSWPDLGNPKSLWDLTSSSNPNGLAGKSPEDPAAEGLQYVPYDESVLLASQLRQHQISGGSSPAVKQPMLLQLNQHQQQMLLQGTRRAEGLGEDDGMGFRRKLGRR